MKFNSRIIGLSVLLGISMGLLDSALGAFVFKEGSFLEVAFFSVPAERIVFRILVLSLFLLFGILVSQHLFQRDLEEQKKAAHTLAESEARFRELAELLPEPVFECDLDFRVTYANRKAFELFGYGPKDLRAGISGLDLLAPGDRPRARESIRGRIEGDDPGVAEYTAMKKDGSTFAMLFHASLIREGDRPTGLRGVIVDITHRKRTEEAIRESERRFRNIVESSPMGIFLYEFYEDGRLVFSGSNPAADLILGVDCSQFLGKTIEEAFPPLAATEIPEGYRQAAREGVPWNSEEVIYEHGVIRGVYQVSAFQTMPGQVAVMFLDITDRKTAVDALRDSEEQFRGVVEQLNDATYILFDGRFDLVNPRFCELTGLTPQEAAAPDFSFWDLVAPGSIPVIRRRQEARERGEDPPGIYEFEVIRRDGHLVNVEASVTEIDYKGGKAVLGLLRDTTTQKGLKEQLRLAQRMESLGRLSGGVAHDLNNLLTPIIGYADLVIGDLPEASEHRDSVEEILRAGRRAQDLVRQLLAFGRRQAMEFKALDLNDMIREFQGLLRRTVREDIQIRLKLASPGPVIRGDRGQLEQVIMNLAVNAQDAMPEGGTLSIETSEVELDDEYARAHTGVIAGHYALMTFSDSGMGMDAATRERIFEPFFTTKERGKGTGLGLATVYGIVKQHEGNIWAYSELGSGTTIKCYLPLAGEPAVERPERAPEARESEAGGTIMVVEDEPAVRSLTVKLLERQGFTVLEAENPSACLEAIQHFDGDLDLLLTDVVMPGMNGRELFGRLRERHPDLRVVYMSGYTEDVITHRGVLDEGIAFVQKPFSAKALASEIRKALESDPPPE